MVTFALTILEFNDKKVIKNIPKKIVIFCNKSTKTKSFMIVIFYTRVTRSIHINLLYEHIKGLLFYLGDLILKHVMCVKL
jgi:hypothetical protein